MRIIGLDLSLTATGVAIIEIDDGGPFYPRTRTVQSSAAGMGIEGRALRMATICNLIEAHVCGFLPSDLVIIEQPAFSRTTGHHHDRSGLWWLAVNRALQHSCTVVEVTPGGLKKYLTGKGSAGKDEVLLAVARRFPEVDVANNNEADALGLAAMGADHLGAPLALMPASHRAALDAVAWPESLAVTS